MLSTPLTTMPKPWKAADMLQASHWTRRLTGTEQAGILKGLKIFLASGIPITKAIASDFPFENIEKLITDIYREIYAEFGIIVMKDFPIQGLTETEIQAMYWGFTNQMGLLRPQGKDSGLIKHVKDSGGAYRNATGRGYNTNSELDFHTDLSDIVGLLCLQEAKSGGISRVSNSLAIYERMQRETPELAKVLTDPIHYSRQGEEAPSEQPFYSTPIVSFADGWFSCRYVRNHTRHAHRHEGAREASPEQIAAMDRMDELANSPEMVFDMRLEPGDFQLLNNHVTLHSRTAFEDYDDPAKKRSLLRSWICNPNSQPLSSALEEAYHDTRAGAVRGGIKGAEFDVDKIDYTRRAATYHGMLIDDRALT
jgi:hypothetical protein